MKNKIAVPFLLAILTLLLGVPAAAQGLNGTDVRPFYVMAHNPNTLADVEQALQCSQPGDPCANALEPDVNVLPTQPFLPYSGLTGDPDPLGLVVYHDYVNVTSRVPATLEEYLQGVHEAAKKHPQLALVLLDIKPAASTPDYGLQIINAVHTILNTDGVQLNVIYNIGSSNDKAVFDKIIPLLGDREGIQIDGEDNAEVTTSTLLGLFNAQQNYNPKVGYGDGTLGPGDFLPRAADLAAFSRASTGYPQVISDFFTIELSASMSFYMDAGVDGIIPDVVDFVEPEYSPILTPPYIVSLQNVLAEEHPELRLATRDDNPFQPENQAYGVEVTTLDVTDGGTDAPLTFTLEGCLGKATGKTVHTGDAPNGYGTGRMEKGGTDHVTIPALNLGLLTKLHIQNHGGAFNAPDWALGKVKVSSAKYIGPDTSGDLEYRATYNKVIPADKTVDIDLTAAFPQPPTTITCPGDLTVANNPGKCSAVVNFNTQSGGVCNDVSTTATPASGTIFDVGMSDVTATATSMTSGNASCSFKVTVQDVEAPLITCPGSQVVPATGPTGAVVMFTPSAADNCSVSSVTSTPASGSVFAIGDTTVNSSASDPAWNQSSCSFNVHVKGAAEQLTDLITYVNGISVDPTNKNALIVKLQQALAKLADANGGPVCGPLKSFINQVSALSGNAISVSDASYLITQANQIRAVVGCS